MISLTATIFVNQYRWRTERFTIEAELPTIGSIYKNEKVESVKELSLDPGHINETVANYNFYELEVFDEATYEEDCIECPDEDI